MTLREENFDFLIRVYELRNDLLPDHFSLF